MKSVTSIIGYSIFLLIANAGNAVSDVRNDFFSCATSHSVAVALYLECDQITDVKYALSLSTFTVCDDEFQTFLNDENNAKLTNKILAKANSSSSMFLASKGLWPYSYMKSDGVIDVSSEPSSSVVIDNYCSVAKAEILNNTRSGQMIVSFRKAKAE